MIEVMIIEDEERIASLLKKMIERVEGFLVTEVCHSVTEALEAYEKKQVPVVFADIDLNGESGMECAAKICDQNPKVKVIFATAHSEFMADAFEIYAFDYIVKPFGMDRVTKTLNRLKEQMGDGMQPVNPVVVTEPIKDKLVVKGKEEIVFIDMDDIIMVERVNGITRIVTGERTYNTSQSLTDLEGKLPTTVFLRSHRSYIINMTKIEKMVAYGRWTFNVSFKGTKETALLTHDKAESISVGV